eukprot:scaffold23035_cov73-Cyclotella_meneghiniana.AAC.11
MSSINVTIRPELSVLLNYVSNKEERCSQWPFNGRNFQAYGFGVEVIRSLTYKDTVDRQTRHDKNIVPTALLLDNSDGDTMQLEFNDEKLIVSRTHTVTRLHQDLIQGDVIQTLNEVTSPTFDMMYNIMCRGETLEMKIIRGDGELLVDHIPKRAKLLKHDTRLDINCLPDAVFELVSSFIPTFVDRLLLAGAVCMPSTSIIGIEPVRELDFVEVDKKVAARLNDNDIRRMLICIDAVNNIVSLKLTNCFRVVGHGLEPLKGSTVLELIDLSLVTKHANPNIHKKSLISEIAVLPVLESIMARGRLCNLKCVQYPEKWIGSSLLGHFQFRLGESRSIRHHCMLATYVWSMCVSNAWKETEWKILLITATTARRHIVIHVYQSAVLVRATIVVGSLTVKSVHNGAANVVAIFAISVPTLETAIIVEFFTVDIMLQWLIALVVIAMNVNGTTAILALTLIDATIATKLAVAIV